MKSTILAATVILLAPLHSNAAISPEKANRISSAANLVALQSANNATVEEAVNALGMPSFVVESRNYKNIDALKLAEGSAVTLVWAHDGCVLSLLSFDKNKQALGAVAPGKTYSANNSWQSCPDYSFEQDIKDLSNFSCNKAKPHAYCKLSKRGGVRDTTIDKQALIASPAHKARVTAQFSTWDGAHINLEKQIKSRMHDPKSYQHVETFYLDRGDHILVTTKFRGKNALGALVLNTARAKVDISGKILALLD